MARKFLFALGVAVATLAVGLVGASAFNPDDGTVARSEALWRLFGIPAEFALAAIPLLVLSVFAAYLVQSARRLTA